MKKFFYIPCIIGATLLASCTSDNDFDNTPSPDDWSNTVTNSNVEIKLGTGSNGTRSSLGDANGLFAANGLGVFCLAKDKLSDDTKLIEINWSRLNESTKTYSLWMDNVKTNATINGDVTELSWADHKTRWYPIGNWHRYSFYGYYPRVEDQNITTSQTKITAKITINGTQDVIWGKADPDPAEKLYAYSGYYFRQPGNDEDIPVLQFEHKLMRLDFYVKAAPDAKGSTANAKNMGVQEIAVKDVPYVGTLTIAHKTSDPNICEDGKLTFESTTKKDFFVSTDDTSGGLSEVCWVEDDAKQVGQGLLVPVPAKGKTYKVKITLANKQENPDKPDKAETMIPNEIELNNTQAQFEAGKNYKVMIYVPAATKVQANAKLTWWVEEKDAIKDIIL